MKAGFIQHPLPITYSNTTKEIDIKSDHNLYEEELSPTERSQSRGQLARDPTQHSLTLGNERNLKDLKSQLVYSVAPVLSIKHDYANYSNTNFDFELRARSFVPSPHVVTINGSPRHYPKNYDQSHTTAFNSLRNPLEKHNLSLGQLSSAIKKSPTASRPSSTQPSIIPYTLHNKLSAPSLWKAHEGASPNISNLARTLETRGTVDVLSPNGSSSSFDEEGRLTLLDFNSDDTREKLKKEETRLSSGGPQANAYGIDLIPLPQSSDRTSHFESARVGNLFNVCTNPVADSKSIASGSSRNYNTTNMDSMNPLKNHNNRRIFSPVKTTHLPPLMQQVTVARMSPSPSPIISSLSSARGRARSSVDVRGHEKEISSSRSMSTSREPILVSMLNNDSHKTIFQTNSTPFKRTISSLPPQNSQQINDDHLAPFQPVPRPFAPAVTVSRGNPLTNLVSYQPLPPSTDREYFSAAAVRPGQSSCNPLMSRLHSTPAQLEHSNSMGNKATINSPSVPSPLRTHLEASPSPYFPTLLHRVVHHASSSPPMHERPPKLNHVNTSNSPDVSPPPANFRPATSANVVFASPSNEAHLAALKPPPAPHSYLPRNAPSDVSTMAPPSILSRYPPQATPTSALRSAQIPPGAYRATPNSFKSSTDNDLVVSLSETVNPTKSHLVVRAPTRLHAKKRVIHAASTSPQQHNLFEKVATSKTTITTTHKPRQPPATAKSSPSQSRISYTLSQGEETAELVEPPVRTLVRSRRLPSSTALSSRPNAPLNARSLTTEQVAALMQKNAAVNLKSASPVVVSIKHQSSTPASKKSGVLQKQSANRHRLKREGNRGIHPAKESYLPSTSSQSPTSTVLSPNYHYPQHRSNLPVSMSHQNASTPAQLIKTGDKRFVAATLHHPTIQHHANLNYVSPHQNYTSPDPYTNSVRGGAMHLIPSQSVFVSPTAIASPGSQFAVYSPREETANERICRLASVTKIANLPASSSLPYFILAAPAAHIASTQRDMSALIELAARSFADDLHAANVRMELEMQANELPTDFRNLPYTLDTFALALHTLLVAFSPLNLEDGNDNGDTDDDDEFASDQAIEELFSLLCGPANCSVSSLEVMMGISLCLKDERSIKADILFAIVAEDNYLNKGMKRVPWEMFMGLMLPVVRLAISFPPVSAQQSLLCCSSPLRDSMIEEKRIKELATKLSREWCSTDGMMRSVFVQWCCSK